VERFLFPSPTLRPVTYSTELLKDTWGSLTATCINSLAPTPLLDHFSYFPSSPSPSPSPLPQEAACRIIHRWVRSSGVLFYVIRSPLHRILAFVSISTQYFLLSATTGFDADYLESTGQLHYGVSASTAARGRWWVQVSLLSFLAQARLSQKTRLKLPPLHSRLLKNYKLAHLRIEEQRTAMLEQEKQVQSLSFSRNFRFSRLNPIWLSNRTLDFASISHYWKEETLKVHQL